MQAIHINKDIQAYQAKPKGLEAQAIKDIQAHEDIQTHFQLNIQTHHSLNIQAHQAKSFGLFHALILGISK